LNKSPLYYIDTSVWLAWLQNEKRKPGEMDGVLDIATKMHKSEVRVITSVLTKTEVLESSLGPDAKQKWDGVLRRKNVQVTMTDDRIWSLASEIRDYYHARREEDDLPTLSTPDAVHLATAILYVVDLFYTFDENDERNKRRALIPLSGNVAGKYNLIIKKPSASQRTLFENIS
jgi:predicted nucleic acid-binding protein